MRSAACTVPMLALLLTSACDSTPASPDYDPVLPTDWAAAVTNPFLPLVPGTVLEYHGPPGSTSQEVNRVEVLATTRVIQGVTATEVLDQVFVDGVLMEETRDWFAQDLDGNVWYLGEDTKELENGVVVSTEGSWEWGVDDALPGIIMWANPADHLNEEYRQEFLRGEAEDWGKVEAIGQTVSVPLGQYTGCVRVLEWNGLESRSEEYKYYCPLVGLAWETSLGHMTRLELVKRTVP